MELEHGQFVKLVEYYRCTFDEVHQQYLNFLNDVKASEQNITGAQIYVSVVPMLCFPPQVSVLVTAGAPHEVGKKVGYFDMTRYLGKNLH